MYAGGSATVVVGNGEGCGTTVGDGGACVGNDWIVVTSGAGGGGFVAEAVDGMLDAVALVVRVT